MKILKWIGIVVGVIIIIIAASAFTLNVLASNRINKTYEVQAENIQIPTDEASLKRGEMLALALCTDCHGGAFEGRSFIDDGSIASVYAPNLTKGNGGVADEYTDIDWVRSIRHGIRPNGQPLFIMPSQYFHNMSEEDLGSLIAYLKTIPPADKEWPQNTYRPMGKILLQVGAFGDETIPAEIIDHEEAFKPAPAVSPDETYGQYLVSFSGCTSCHGKNFGGAPGLGPEDPDAPNISPSGNISKWTTAQFIETMRTGITPEGKELKPESMPISFGKYSDDDLTAIHKYLAKLEPVVAEK